jgi:hypothetical protein
MNFTLAFTVIILSPLIIIIMVRWFVLRNKNVPYVLYTDGLRKENGGDYEAALIAYENALIEVKKNRFSGNTMKNKIMDKLKVLNTVISYKNNSQFRQVI